MIDPYKREVRKFEADADIFLWQKMFQCDCCACTTLLAVEGNPAELDIWYDDEFLCKEPVGPAFKIASGTNREAVFHGYAFLAAHDGEGNTVSLADPGMSQSNKTILRVLRLQFETWEKRLDPNLYLDQQLRMFELEFPGRFKFLDKTEQSG